MLSVGVIIGLLIAIFIAIIRKTIDKIINSVSISTDKINPFRQTGDFISSDTDAEQIKKILEE